MTLDGDERVWGGRGGKEEKSLTNSKFLQSPFNTGVAYWYVPMLKSRGRSPPAPLCSLAPLSLGI